MITFIIAVGINIIDKPRKENIVEYFLSRLTLPIGEEGMVDVQLPDEHLFSISVLPPRFADIENYLVSSNIPLNLSSKEERDGEEGCPIHLDWWKPLQTRSRSNFEYMCQGGGSL